MLLIFAGVNAQFYDPVVKSVRLVNLTCKEVNQRHFAANIKTWLLDIIHEFLPDEREQQTFVYSVDSAANISKAVNDVVTDLNKNILAALEEESNGSDTVHNHDTDSVLNGMMPALEVIPDELKQVAYKVNCVVHKFALAVNKFLHKDEEVKGIVDKAIVLTTKLRTPIIKEKLDFEKLKQAKAFQVTRWNSVQLMLQRIIELKEFCQQNEDVHETLFISDEMWTNFEELLKVLDIAAYLTTVLQSEKLLVPDFIYHWFKMTSQLTRIGSRFSKKLLSCIQTREKEIFDNDVIKTGWFLDKTVSLLIEEPDIVETAKSLVRMVHKKRLTMLGAKAEELVDLREYPESDDDDGCDMGDDDFDKFLNQKGKGKAVTEINLSRSADSATSSQPRFDQLEAEILAYTRSEVPRKRADPIDWWLDNQEKFPLLSPIALDIVSVPLTEVSVERLFSHLNLILTKNRSSLKGALLDDILFLRLNKVFVK